VTQIERKVNNFMLKGIKGVLKALILATGIVLMVLSAGQAYSGTSDAPTIPKEDGKTLKADQPGSISEAAPAKSGSSVVERDKKRYENQKRAADRRAAEMKKADKAKKPSKSGSSVVERDKKRYDAQKRAADQRAAEMNKAKKAEMMKDEKKKEPIDVQGQTKAK
jgi:hypothetical protein